MVQGPRKRNQRSRSVACRLVVDARTLCDNVPATGPREPSVCAGGVLELLSVHVSKVTNHMPEPVIAGCG